MRCARARRTCLTRCLVSQHAAFVCCGRWRCCSGSRRRIRRIQDPDERGRDDEDQGAGPQRERVYMYDLRWRADRVDSLSFNDRSFQNPSEDAWIYRAKDILADAVVVGDFKLSDELIKLIPRRDGVSLSAESMAVMRNVLNQRVGEHWYEASGLKRATIEDDYVYLLRDGGSPALGDLRVSFKVVPPYTVTISGKQELQHIMPFTSRQGESILLIADGALEVHELYDHHMQTKYQHNRFYRLFTTVLAFIGFHVGEAVVLGLWGPRMGKTHTALLCAALAFALVCSVAGFNWALHRPLWAFALLCIALVPLGTLVLISRPHESDDHEKRD
ncbi:hypothetical protein PINS_up013128 [Pythium insidiosum]|nr:hypothetical protein PINS_up013128 [Pythium insidiosum]